LCDSVLIGYIEIIHPIYWLPVKLNYKLVKIPSQRYTSLVA